MVFAHDPYVVHIMKKTHINLHHTKLFREFQLHQRIPLARIEIFLSNVYTI